VTPLTHKHTHTNLLTLEFQRANILKEVQIMRGIDHPSIVKLLGFTESDEHYFLILERECPHGMLPR
jgi:serine/threonine protein kinase